MKVQEFALPDVSGTAASLFADRWVIVITPLAEDSDWATAAAWSVARAAAETGRRTALIDLCLDEPKLHSQATRPLDTGIVDAFLFGASLQHVASQDENPNLHFIGVGTPTAEADAVLEHKRWERLSRGFRKEEALLFLFLPTSGLESLSLSPDLIIALAPNGFGPGDPRDPFLRSALDRGFPMVVVTDVDASDDGNETAAVGGLGSTNFERSKVVLPLLGVALAVVILVAVSLILGRDTAPLDAGGEDADTSTRDEQTLPTVPIPSGPVDTLAYSIQVAAWARLDNAFEHFDELFDAGIPATISAVARDSASVWYRVFVGAVPNRAAAEELRERLRSQAIIGSVRGVLAVTPHAFLLSTHPDSVSGRREVEGLRESGIPAYIVSMPDGSVQVLFGAFQSPEQAELADSVLAGNGGSLSKVLVTRVGIAR